MTGLSPSVPPVSIYCTTRGAELDVPCPAIDIPCAGSGSLPPAQLAQISPAVTPVEFLTWILSQGTNKKSWRDPSAAQQSTSHLHHPLLSITIWDPLRGLPLTFKSPQPSSGQQPLLKFFFFFFPSLLFFSKFEDLIAKNTTSSVTTSPRSSPHSQQSNPCWICLSLGAQGHGCSEGKATQAAGVWHRSGTRAPGGQGRAPRSVFTQLWLQACREGISRTLGLPA